MNLISQTPINERLLTDENKIFYISYDAFLWFRLICHIDVIMNIITTEVSMMRSFVNAFLFSFRIDIVILWMDYNSIILIKLVLNDNVIQTCNNKNSSWISKFLKILVLVYADSPILNSIINTTTYKSFCEHHPSCISTLQFLILLPSTYKAV